MKKNYKRLLPCVLLLTVFSCILPGSKVHAQDAADSSSGLDETQDREDCKRNLKAIFQAITAYKAEHGEVPNWLSDLVPQYASDQNIFICPVCKKTGQAESSGDPKLSTSYIYLFSPSPLGKSELADPSVKNHREYSLKLLQSIGPVVPMVRCVHHGVMLNLSYDGTIYQSPLPPELVPAPKPKPAPQIAATNSGLPVRILNSPNTHALNIPKRDPKAEPSQIDLTDFYNASFDQSWLGGVGDDLATLPTGLQKFNGVVYDVRGIVQLSGAVESTRKFPVRVKNIPVHLRCDRLHFIQATSYGVMEDNGHQVGSYIVHFATNQMQAEIPLRYGQEIRNWHGSPGQKFLKTYRSGEVWTGTNLYSATSGRNLRLFSTTWANVAPNLEIESIDFVSSLGNPAPFLIAITAE